MCSIDAVDQAAKQSSDSELISKYTYLYELGRLYWGKKLMSEMTQKQLSYARKELARLPASRLNYWWIRTFDKELKKYKDE